MTYHFSASKRPRALGYGGGGGGQRGGVSYDAINTVATSIYAPRLDSRSTGARSNCLPESWGYPPAWLNQREQMLDEDCQTPAIDAAGNPITVDLFVSQQLYSLCDCVQAPNGSDGWPVPGVPASEIDAIAGRPNTQQRIDFCWSTRRFGLAATAFLPGTVLPGGQRTADKNLCVPTHLRGVVGGGTTIDTVQWVRNFPNPCHKRWPVPCEAVKAWERGEAARGERPALWYEKEPQAARHGGRPVHYFPVDMHVSDQARFVFTGRRDQPFQPGRETAASQPNRNVPYLKQLKAARDRERLLRPISGVSGIYTPSIPDSVSNKHNLMVAGTVVATLGLLGAVALATRKR